MQIYPAGSRPTRRAPAENFTGTVWQDPVIAAPAPARVVINRVAFEPGARTAWHSHPFGQTLYVISGVGRFQTKGEPIREIKAGDVIWIPPGEKHWHGGAPTTGMVHIATQEAHDGKTANWMEHVTDAEYNAAIGSRDPRPEVRVSAIGAVSLAQGACLRGDMKSKARWRFTAPAFHRTIRCAMQSTCRSTGRHARCPIPTNRRGDRIRSPSLGRSRG